MKETGIRVEISAMRRSYGEVGLDKLPADPVTLFEEWMAAAAANEIIVEANAMVLSTADGSGEITTRTVLLKDISLGGFTFFTNYSSRKAQAIAMNSQVTLLFPWYAMERQVIISGQADKISREESENYFATRPWSSQIGAWASVQSAKVFPDTEHGFCFADRKKTYKESAADKVWHDVFAMFNAKLT